MPVPSTAMVEPGAGQAAAMRGGVDAEREAGDDGQARLAQRAGERLGVALALRGGVAAADDGERGALQQLDAAARVEQRRRIGDLEQQPADRCRRRA